jgi:hypothetical protein
MTRSPDPAAPAHPSEVAPLPEEIHKRELAMSHPAADAVLFNYLPPAWIHIPSPAFSILKEFLRSQGYQSTVLYWNLLLGDLMSAYGADSRNLDVVMELLPFFQVISTWEDDPTTVSRICSRLQSLRPDYRNRGCDYYRKSAASMGDLLVDIINRRLEELCCDDLLLFATSSKFFQWVSAHVLVSLFKKKHPGKKSVIGGFGSSAAALEVLRTSRVFDFAIWGEGEYPLLELLDRISKGSSDYSTVPRLVYREGDRVRASDVTRSTYLDFANYPSPSHDDYLDQVAGRVPKSEIVLPVNSIRGCHWNKCRFCICNMGYAYRERSPRDIADEIEGLVTRHGLFNFLFVDTDIIGRSLERFEQLLDLLIAAGNHLDHDLTFSTDLAHQWTPPAIIKKMSICGFQRVLIGYEAISDEILAKMRKSNTVASNILFVKHALKYGKVIKYVNLVTCTPDETEQDVLDSMENLHLLRFFLGRQTGYVHSYSQFQLQRGMSYFESVPDSVRVHLQENDVEYFLPRSLIDGADKFELFSYQLERHQSAWREFKALNDYYTQTHFEYRIMRDAGILYYDEYRNQRKINSIVFDKPEHVEVLQATNNRVCSFQELLAAVQIKHAWMTDDRLKGVLEELRAEGLVYFRRGSYDDVVAIVDVGG